MTKDWRYVFFLLFFVLLGIPMTLLPSLMHGVPIYNDLLIKTFQSTNIFDSPPTAYSYLLFFPALFVIYDKEFGRKHIAILGVILFLLFGTKFYTAFLLMNILFIFRFIRALRKKISWKIFLLELLFYGGMIAASLIIFLNPLATIRNGPMFVFSPFASVHHLIEEPGLFYSKNLSLARYFLYEHGWSPRLVLIELYSSFLFFLFYFGTRIIGIIYLLWKYSTKKATEIEVAAGIAIAISMFMSIMFVQRGDWFNPIQFAVVAAHLLSVYAAFLCFSMLKKNKHIFFIFFVLLTIFVIPSNLVNFKYLSSEGRYVISNNEIQALNFLKQKKNGDVFFPIEMPDSPYIPVFTGKATHFNFIHVLDNFGINPTERSAQIANFNKNSIDTLKAKYVYLPKHQVIYSKFFRLFIKSRTFKLVFNNTDVAIFEKSRK